MSNFATKKNPKNWIIFALASLMMSAVTVYATSEESAADVSREYHLKAAFLRYVAQFVTWPEGSHDEEIVNICLNGQVPSLTGLNSINGRMIDNIPILVRPITNLEKAKEECKILFIMKSEQDKIDKIIKDYKGAPVLTFGDMEDFAQKGGAMNFYVANNRMAIMINQKTVADANLKIEPRMLRLVTILPGEEIEPEGNQEPE